MPLKRVICIVLLAVFLPFVCAADELKLEHLKSDKPLETVSKSDQWENIGRGFALGYDFGLHWFRMSVRNDTNATKTFYVEFSEPFADKCDFYIVQKDNTTVSQNGLSVPMDKRAIQSFLPTAKLELRAHDSADVYVKYKSRFTSYGSFRLYDESKWRQELSLYTSVFMLYFGAVGIMILYNLFLFLSLRDVTYFYYVGHAFSFAIWVFLYSGLSLYFIDSSWHYRLHFTTPFAFAFFTLYSVAVLQIKEHFALLHKITLWFCAMLFFVSAVTVIDLENGYLLANIVGILFFPFFIFLAIFSIQKGVQTAKFYLASLLPYLLSMSIVSNLAMGLIDYGSFAKFSFIAGSAIELTLFSLLLAYRIHIIKAKQLAAQNALLNMEVTKADELQRIVKEKTSKLISSNKLLEDALDERTLLLREVHHRVKNNLQLITALLWIQGSKTDSIQAKTALKESAVKIKSIAVVHELLYASANLKSIDMAIYLPQIAKNLLAASTNKITPITYELQSVFLDADQASALGMITAEIVTNSLKYADVKDSILRLWIKLYQDGLHLRLLISDNGEKEPQDLNIGNTGIGLIAQMSGKLKNSNYRFRYDNGVIFELEFDIG